LPGWIVALQQGSICDDDHTPLTDSAGRGQTFAPQPAIVLTTGGQLSRQVDGDRDAHNVTRAPAEGLPVIKPKRQPPPRKDR